MRKRVVIVGAGLCGAVLATRLRDAFDVTVVEQSRKRHPLYDDIVCAGGGVTTTINRAAGPGGTTNYWHNALIELDRDDLDKCGLDARELAAYYRQAWSFFLSEEEIAAAAAIGARNAAAVPPTTRVAHMVVPQARANAWIAANRVFPGRDVAVRYGRAERIVAGKGTATQVVVRNGDAVTELDADHVIVCAGGLATPAILASSIGHREMRAGGYHDHPMAYVAKVRLRPESVLKRISCADSGALSVRTGFVYQAGGLKAVFYLRPALSLDLRPITGEARYVLSDLRNDPFSPRKIIQLLGNIEALREAVLFKTRAGFRGDYYSVLMLGEQRPVADRGLLMRPSQLPELNWHVRDDEHSAYQESLGQFLGGMAGEIVEQNVVDAAKWDYRTAAHHSGTGRDFLDPTAPGLDFFAAQHLPGVFVCDGSVLRSGGVANSGLTLVALSLRLAERLIAERA
ncbi:MAG TPA: hypothetical protein VGL65_04525 [Gemmatimonadales bacterium]